MQTPRSGGAGSGCEFARLRAAAAPSGRHNAAEERQRADDDAGAIRVDPDDDLALLLALQREAGPARMERLRRAGADAGRPDGGCRRPSPETAADAAPGDQEAGQRRA